MIVLFHTPSLMLCFAACVLIGALSMSVIWLSDRSRLDLTWWMLAFWSGTAGMLLLTLRGAAPPWAVAGFGNAFAIAGLAIFSVGLGAFERRPRLRNAVLIGPAGLWLGLYFLLPGFSDALNLRIILGSGLLAGLSLLIAVIAWRDRRSGFFSTRRMLALFFACHGVTHLLRVPLAILAPATIEADGQIASGWYAVHVFVLYTQILLAGMALFALVRERIEEKYRIESETDALTAVLNRRAFMARLGEALERRQPGALALLDLDHFKRINDSHGHPAGDGVLVAFSAAVRDGLPEGAVFGRIGGEEFAVWLSHCDGEAALGLCERIRRLTEALCIPTATGTVRPTVSIGLCSDIVAGASVEAAIAVADHALYLSKHNGRNRVTMTALHDGLETVKRSLSAATDAAASSSSALKAG